MKTGNGAFKNLFVYAAGGKKDGLQIMPFSQVAAKDEFTGIKDATRDDLLAAHRVPPVLMGVMPNNSGGFGDVEKAAKVFSINELAPIQESLKELNDWLGIDVVRFNPYALLQAAILRQPGHTHHHRAKAYKAITDHTARKPLSSPLAGAFLLPQPPQRTENDAAARHSGAKIGADNTDPISPLSARSFPRLARTQKPRFFVQMCRPAEGPPRLACPDNTNAEIFVHLRAIFCSVFDAIKKGFVSPYFFYLPHSRSGSRSLKAR